MRAEYNGPAWKRAMYWVLMFFQHNWQRIFAGGVLLLVFLAFLMLILLTGGCVPPVDPTPDPTATLPPTESRALIPEELARMRGHHVAGGDPECQVCVHPFGWFGDDLSRPENYIRDSLAVGDLPRPSYDGVAFVDVTSFVAEAFSDRAPWWQQFISIEYGGTVYETKVEHTDDNGEYTSVLAFYAGVTLVHGERLELEAVLVPFVFADANEAYHYPAQTNMALDALSPPEWVGPSTELAAASEPVGPPAPNWYDAMLIRFVVLAYEPGLPPLYVGHWFDGRDIAGQTGTSSWEQVPGVFPRLTDSWIVDLSGLPGSPSEAQGTIAMEIAAMPLDLASVYWQYVQVTAFVQ